MIAELKKVDTKADICAIPIPKQTSTYKPIPYCDLINYTLDAAAEQGLILKNEVYKTANDGMIVSAYYDFEYGDDPELGLRIAWQNSYNKKVSLKFAIGAHVFVCSNGACFGDIANFKKKHVGDVQTVTPEIIREYIATAKTVYNSLVEMKTLLKGISLTKRQVSSVVGDLYLHLDLLKETQIAIIKKEIANPSCDYNAPDSAWELYNHITFALRDIHPSLYIDTHIGVNDYFKKRFL